jgi:hypothetical protein
MHFSEIKSTIKTGDVLAFSHGSWRTWREIKALWVRIFTRSEYSHVATAIVKDSEVFVIEAVIPAVRISRLSDLSSFYHIPMDAPWTTETTDYIMNIVGEDYSQLEAMESYFEVPKLDKKWQCAELVRAIYLKMGIDLGTKVTPAGIVKACQL